VSEGLAQIFDYPRHISLKSGTGRFASFHQTIEKPMVRANYYVPRISRFLVCVLFHERKRRNVSMTQLVDELLTDALCHSPGWKIAENQTSESSASNDKDRHNADY